MLPILNISHENFKSQRQHFWRSTWLPNIETNFGEFQGKGSAHFVVWSPNAKQPAQTSHHAPRPRVPKLSRPAPLFRIQLFGVVVFKMAAVVPVQQTNVVVTSHQVFNTHVSMEEMRVSEMSLMPVQTDDSGGPPAKKARESTGKWKGYDSKRIFKKEWEERYAWVSAVPEDPTSAYCKICGKKIRAHKGDIEKHQKTKRHLKKQTTSDILADLIPISCEGVPQHMGPSSLMPALGPGCSTSYQNLDGTKNNDIESNGDARGVPPTAQVPDGQQQIIYFTESAVDSAHQAANTVIDKLVEKYHQRRLDNLKIEHDAILQLYKDQLLLSQRETQSKVEADAEKSQFERMEHEARLRFMQEEHSSRLKAIEEEHSAKLRAIEQELLFAQQEYEKKMRLLDVQLSSMNKI